MALKNHFVGVIRSVITKRTFWDFLQHGFFERLQIKYNKSNLKSNWVKGGFFTIDHFSVPPVPGQTVLASWQCWYHNT